MDSNSEVPYFSPVEDEKTAIMKSIKNLRDIEVRCSRAAPMCYSSSSANEKKAFYVRSFEAAVSGAMALLTGGAATSTIQLKFKTYLPSKYTPYLFGAGFAIVAFAGTVQGIGKVIPRTYEENAKKYNQAAAEWQELELRIQAYLAAAVKDTRTLESYKEFTEVCAKKRKEICLIACPDQSVYNKYESAVDLVVDRKLKLRKIQDRLQKEDLY